MTNCNQCGEKPKKSCTAFPKAVVEINNPEKIVLFRKVVIPASMGDRDALPPAIGKYHNVLLEYEADGSLFLYSSDGIPTQLSTDVTDLQRQLDALGVRVDTEHAERVSADEGLSGDIENEALARQDGDTALGNRITDLDNSLATVAKTGSYNDLSNKPTIGNGTLTVKRNNTSVGTFNANATTNTSINIAVPTQTSQLTNNGSSGNSAYVEADDLANVATSGDYNDLSNKPVPDSALSLSSNNAVRNSTISNALNRNVMTDINLNTNASTTTVQIDGAKRNLYSGATSTKNLALPVASSTEAGVMNTATFNAVSNNTNNINALLNGAVAVTGLPASPTQADITSAWQAETGLSTLINRASVYDVTNNKVWTYYTNDQTWHAASNTSQVTVNTFTNTSEGVIKGSTNVGQIFAENDGTGSVNGWDTISNSVSANTSNISSLQTAVAGKQDTLTAGSNITIAGNTISANVPTVNNATLTIQKNGANVQTFTANSSTNKTANITVPTAVSELTNDANYATTTQLNNGLATKQDTLTAGDNIQINGNTISATDTTYTAGNAIDITNGEISADIHPADFFTAENAVSDCGSELSLDDTMASTLRSVELKGDTYQQTYSGYNLINLVPMTKEQPSFYQQCTIETVADSTLGRNVLHVAGTNSFPSAVYQLPQRLESGKYYVLKFTYRSTMNSTATHPELWFAPNWSGNNWDVLGSITNDHMRPGDGDTASMTPQSTNWKTTCRKFYVDPSRYSSVDTSYSRICFSLGNNSNSAGSEGKEVWLADAEVYEITEDEWNADTYTSKDFEPYVGGIPAPNPDYPQEIHTVTGEQTVTVTGKNLLNLDSAIPTVNSSLNIIEQNSNNLLLEAVADSGNYNNANYRLNLRDIGVNVGETYTISANISGTYTGANGASIRISKNNSASGADILARTSGEPATFTIPEGTTSIGIFFYVRQGSAPAIGSTASFANIQLERNDSATVYEPYKGIQAYTVDLRGKNLLDISKFEMGGINASGIVSASTTYRIQNRNSMIKVHPNTTYTISAQLSEEVKGFRVGAQQFDGNRNFLYDPGWQQLATQDYTFTTRADTEYIAIVGSLSTTNANVTTGGTENTTPYTSVSQFMRGCTLMLEKGSTATDYEPYNAIELCKIGDYQDYIYKNGDDWYVHKAVRHLQLPISGMNNSDSNPGWTNQTQVKTDLGTTSGGQIYTDTTMVTNIAGLVTSESRSVTKNFNGNNAILLLPTNYYGNDYTQTYWKTNYANLVVDFYYGINGTIAGTRITDATLVGQLNALGAMRSYDDQTNIIVAATGDNLPATLCVTTYRKSLDGVLDLINDTACTCKNRQGNLVITLPNGMTTYTNNDAPIPISEVSEAFKRGQSVFLVDEALNDVYTVTAVNMDDGVWSMRADQTGINPRKRDGYWHINGGGDVWDSVTFINDATPSKYSLNFYDKTWDTFTSSTPLLDQSRRTYYPASRDVTFNNGYGSLSVAELWEKLASSAWNGNPVVLEVPLQEISTRTTGLVDNGFTAESPYLTISVSLGPDNYFERETPEYTITGWAAEWTPLVYDRKGAYTVGIVRVVENGNTTYSFVVSLTEVEKPVG